MLWISTSAYSSFRVQDVRKTCACAAMGGKLEVLQWADGNGCPWDEQTCYWAARLRRSVTALAPAACREKEKERRNEEPRKDDKIENSDTTDIKNKSGS